MSGDEYSAGVAEDYRQALEELNQNLRVEIITLTNIAKESITHAAEISNVLRDHIEKSHPNKTLPALYVLDSIVKNVGKPYTLYLHSKLYSIFMGAYAKVDNATRRKMEEMLKTWKEPVPGAMGNTPVFGPDVTRPIENALIDARSKTYAAHQENMQRQQQLLGRPRVPMQFPVRDTPTPPGVRPGSQHSGPSYGQQAYPGPNGRLPPYDTSMPQTALPLPVSKGTIHLSSRAMPQYGAPVPMQQQQQQQQQPMRPPYPGYQGVFGAPPHGTSIDKLRADIHRLMQSERAEVTRFPHDLSRQTKLKALLDLELLIQRPDVPQEHLMLSASIPAHPINLQVLHNSTNSTNSAYNQAHAIAMSPVRARAAEAPKPAASLAADPLALLAMLKKTGVLAAAGSGPTPPSVGGNGNPTGATAPLLASTTSLADILAAVRPAEAMDPSSFLQPASLMQYRADYVQQLYGDLGPPCRLCGRRFKEDEQGRNKKTAHLDWHFRVNQRIAEAEKKGQHRSWYVTAEDWIKSRECTDEALAADADAAGSGEGGAHAQQQQQQQQQQQKQQQQGPKVQWIRAPDPGDTATNKVCPICQEEFDSEYMKEGGVDDWVWLDAVRVSGRVFHASCFAAAAKDRGATPAAAAAMVAASAAEPSVLGKRKMEDDNQPFRQKTQM
ncbi:hypothetical protein P8C59_004326 [Phyllachora maydis]|uniref:CID domain-containing protein n=1 Tax=Phyllachora maydis TaxID=1825666 RepID=A0AAD9I372_9PEZI|nr:hypothetical protein P8C59_004326 [Phyllachora maydis]